MKSSTTTSFVWCVLSLAIIGFTLATSACDSGRSSQFVGTWRSEVFKFVKDGNKKVEDQVASWVASGLVDAMELQSELTVSKDGTFAMTTTGYVLGAKQSGVRTGKWKSSGDQFTLVDTGNKETSFKFAGDKLVHTDGAGSTIVFKR